MSGARCSGTNNDDYGHQMTVSDIERLMLAMDEMQARIDLLESKLANVSVGDVDTKDAESIWSVPIDEPVVSGYGASDERPFVYDAAAGTFAVSDSIGIQNTAGDGSVASIYAEPRLFRMDFEADDGSPYQYTECTSDGLSMRDYPSGIGGAYSQVTFFAGALPTGNHARFLSVTYKNSAGSNETRYFLCTDTI